MLTSALPLSSRDAESKPQLQTEPSWITMVIASKMSKVQMCAIRDGVLWEPRNFVQHISRGGRYPRHGLVIRLDVHERRREEPVRGYGWLCQVLGAKSVFPGALPKARPGQQAGCP